MRIICALICSEVRMSHPLNIEADEMTRLLNCRPATLAHKARRLHERHGFPRALPGMPLTWSRRLVEAWVNSGGAITPAATANADAPAREKRSASLIEEQRAALEDRYAGGPA